MKLVDVVNSLVCDQKITEADMVRTIIYLVDSIGTVRKLKEVKNYVDNAYDYESDTNISMYKSRIELERLVG